MKHRQLVVDHFFLSEDPPDGAIRKDGIASSPGKDGEQMCPIMWIIDMASASQIAELLACAFAIVQYLFGYWQCLFES